MNGKPYKTDGDVVTTCGWCHPGSTIIALYPELSGKKISHGICNTHKEAMLKDLQAHAHLMVRK